MIFYKFYKSHRKSKVSVFDFVAWNFTSSTSPIQSPKVPVFGFVAWMHLQVTSLGTRDPRFLEEIGRGISRPDRFKEQWSYGNDITAESRTWILHVIISTKSRTHACWGNWCFRGTILYRIKGIPSHHLSPLQNQNLMDPKKNGLMEMILLQNQEPEFYNILHLISLHKIKDPTMLGKKGSGELSFTESNSFPLTISKPLQNQDLKIWH